MGWTRPRPQARSEELLEFMGLANEPKKLIADFSHGMGKKLALAAAVIHGPKVLFLDEPFEGVDAIAAGTLKSMLQGMIARGATIFLTSHVLEIVERLCSHIAIIHRGHIVANGRWTSCGPASGPADAGREVDCSGAAYAGGDLSERGGRRGGGGAPGAGADMAGHRDTDGWTAAQTRAQFEAIAWLRWRIFVNGFRRKGGAGEIVARGVAGGCCSWGCCSRWWWARSGVLIRRRARTWCGFRAAMGYLRALPAAEYSAGPADDYFDPTQLIRFPMRASVYGGAAVLRDADAGEHGGDADVAGDGGRVEHGGARAVGVCADGDGGLCGDECAVFADDLCVGGPLALDAAGARGLYGGDLRRVAGDSVGELQVQPGL